MRSIKRNEAWYLLCIFLLLLAGCKNNVPRPNTNICLNNVPKLEQECYNLQADYDSDGNLKPDAHPLIIVYPSAEAMLLALNKGFSTDPQGWANLKAYLRDLRD